jgi:ribose transport system ATP-binding protein
VVTEDVANVDHDQVVGWILGGADLAPGSAAAALAPTGSPRLVVDGLQGPGVAEPLSFTAAAGETVALCGLVGCGAREVAELLGGARTPSRGTATLDGRALPLGRPTALRRVGCTYVPGDRQGAGGVAGLSVRENLFLHRDRGSAGDAFVRRPGSERGLARRLAERFDVRPLGAVDGPLATLSGGNQQKVIAGRALRSGPRLLVVDDPTAGVDIGSRAQLHDIMRRATADGTVLVMASTDFEEVASQADRALVMYHGRVCAELRGAALTAERLAQASYGSAATTPNPVPVKSA